MSARANRTMGSSHSTIFNYDPAFQVVYEPNYDPEREWEEISSVRDLRRRISRFPHRDNTSIFLSLDDAGKCDLRIVFEATTSLVLPETVTPSSRSCCIRICVEKGSEVRSVLSMFSKENLAMVVLEPPVEGFSDYRLGCARSIGRFGTVVFWEVWGALSLVGTRPTYFYHTRQAVDEFLEIAGRAPFVGSPSTPIGMISVDVDKRYGTFACVPAYFFAMSGEDVSPLGIRLVVDEATSFGQIACSTGFPDSMTGEIVSVCARVYRTYFAERILPRSLPLYDPKALLYALADES